MNSSPTEKPKKDDSPTEWQMMVFCIICASIYFVLWIITGWISGGGPIEWWQPLLLPLLPFIFAYEKLQENWDGFVLFVGIALVYYFGSVVIDLLRRIADGIDGIRSEHWQRHDDL